jgi:nicotinamidase-related amidase
VFTRFMTPNKARDMPGMWQRYYARWNQTTREYLDPALLGLMPALARFSPPATVIDKDRYSAFAGGQLLVHLQERETDGLIMTGSETDVCVLATALSAVDLGYRVILVRASDEGHEALMKLYHQRFSEQIETADMATILSAWE